MKKYFCLNFNLNNSEVFASELLENIEETCTTCTVMSLSVFNLQPHTTLLIVARGTRR